MREPPSLVFIDRGGTFTDAIARDSRTGRISVAKLLSSDRAPIEAVRKLLGVAKGQQLPACEVRMGTTLATNAVLERRGAKTALVITRGFGDLLRIGDQTRPDLFALHIDRPEPLYAEVLEVAARCSSDGSVLDQPDEPSTRAQLADLAARGFESVAIVVLHAYRNPELELRLGAWAREAGIGYASLSHAAATEQGFLARAETAVVDAYVTPVLSRYLAALQSELQGQRLLLMQSSGGLCDPEALRGHHALLSGPAGGAVAVATLAERHCPKPARAIGLDMGGTSTDVTRYGGELERVYETRVAGLRVRAPAVDVHTVAAGGGSLCRLDGNRLSVGPESAGADPGPLCYGRVQPDSAAEAASHLALTDINLKLGRVIEDRFPFALHGEPVEAALAHIASSIGGHYGPYEVAQGFFDVAIERMAEAIRSVSITRGHDVREHALIAFGGASGQHACALARRLGIRRVLLHPLSGVLSAFGMGGAAQSHHAELAASGRDLSALPQLESSFEALVNEASTALVTSAWKGTSTWEAMPAPRVVRRVELRYRGAEASIMLELADARALAERFGSEHRARFGYERAGHPIELVTLRAEAILPQPTSPELAMGAPTIEPLTPLRHTQLFLRGAVQRVPLYAREQLGQGARLEGPAIVIEDIGTVVLEADFSLQVLHDGTLELTHNPDAVSEPAKQPKLDEPDPVQLEVMGHRFMAIAEQMGHVLQRTALSTNIRDRLDFSCALFDFDGGLVANAPHIPVHLGAMSESVRAVLERNPHPEPGDAFCTNDPALGGSHLPDITVVTPVFDAGGKLILFTASRGHHADVGGITPGSMPPFSTRLDEEGIVFRAERIARRGELDEAFVRSVLEREPYPARDPTQNLADLRAQLAANQRGAVAMAELCAERGLPFVAAYMRHVQTDASQRVRAAIARLPDGEHRFHDELDDGSRIAVTLRVLGERLAIDFTGTSGEHALNLNAPRAVTVAAVLYVLRALCAAPIPLNGGCLEPVTLVIPEPSLLAPRPSAAVASGNVETSQRVVDVLFGALGVLAASQGTMNNLTFGNARFGYYETIAGGAGASAKHHGASGVHTHMTNTRITDTELLEARFPVRVLQLALRKRSGGAGRCRGGDGVVRELQALEPLEVAIVSDRRKHAPFGLDGGAPGAVGRNLLNDREVPGRASFQMQPGDRLRIETPGGGGFGKA